MTALCELLWIVSVCVTMRLRVCLCVIIHMCAWLCAGDLRVGVQGGPLRTPTIPTKTATR
jgi:hypothetical protein